VLKEKINLKNSEVSTENTVDEVVANGITDEITDGSIVKITDELIEDKITDISANESPEQEIKNNIETNKLAKSEEKYLEENEIKKTELIDELIILNEEIKTASFAEKVFSADEIIVEKSVFNAGIESVFMDVNDLEVLKNNPDIEAVYMDNPVSVFIEDRKE
jgi:hypothetical protein